MELESCVPPGFRFHPTEEELLDYYLKRKINSLKIDLDVIVDIDLYKIEPWDIQAKCSLGYDEQKEWYFFSHKDRKYPTGTRTNRATAAGFWKATGRDKAVLSKNKMIGMRKTLVFYKGRAPNGRKTDWIMHEYRLQSSENAPTQEEGWVVCRAFKKPTPSHQRQLGFEAWNHAYYLRDINNGSSHIRPPLSSSSSSYSHDHIIAATNNNMVVPTNQTGTCYQPQLPLGNSSSDQEYVSSSNNLHHSFFDNQQQFIELPQLDSPATTISTKDCDEENSINKFDWKNLDSLLGIPYPNNYELNQEYPGQVSDIIGFLHQDS